MPSIKKDPPPSRLFVTFVTQKMFFWLRQSVCLSICLSGTSLSVALNFHLSSIGLSQVSLR